MIIIRPWLLVIFSSIGLVFFYVFYRYGALSKKTLIHPLFQLIIRDLPPQRWSRRWFYFIFCGSLVLLGLASSGPRWGSNVQSEFNESRVLGFIIDRSGSIGGGQDKLIIDSAKKLLEKFRKSATITIVPFADKANPSPLFTLAIAREYDYAITYLNNLDKIDVGGGTEGAWALYQTFEKLMAPQILKEKDMRMEILPRLKNREIKLYENDLVKVKKCRVKDRAVIIGTDAEFYENSLNSAEVLELYRICGVRAYLLSIKGGDPVYLRQAVEATRGNFKFVSVNIADNPTLFKKTIDDFFNDVLAVELSPQKVRESTVLISRSWIFALAGLAMSATAFVLRFALKTGR